MENQNLITKNESLALAAMRLDIINQLYCYYTANCNRILTLHQRAQKIGSLNNTLRICKHNILFKLLYSLQ